MAYSPNEIILPRPGGVPTSSQTPIPGPTEAAFTQVFGALLPPAKFLSTAKGKVAYYELTPSSPSDQSGTPSRVLLVHGVQTPALGLLPLARALQTSFPHAHLVLFDLWGHGLSDTPIAPHDAGLFHQLLDALLDQLHWPSAHLVGFSFGGGTVTGYTALRPSRVESLTLIAPVGLFRLSDLSPEERGLLYGDNEVAARKWVFEWLGGDESGMPAGWKQRVEKGEIVAQALRQWQLHEHPGHVASVAAMVRDGCVFDKHAEYLEVARTGIPSLAVLGELDDVCDEKQLNEHGFANVAVVPQVGHELVRERVPEVAALIRDFWTKLGKANNS